VRKKYYEAGDIFNIDALVNYVIQSDEFVDAVAESRKGEIEGLIEQKIEDVDFKQFAEGAAIDYSTEFEEVNQKIEDLEHDLHRKMRNLEDQNARLFLTLEELEEELIVLKTQTVRYKIEALAAWVVGYTNYVKMRLRNR
jgi:ferritin-like protein